MAEEPTTGAFAELVALPDTAIPLAHAALLLAADEYPGLDVDAYLRRIDVLASEAAPAVRAANDPTGAMRALCNHLFVRARFAGNTDNYYDPRNSYLNDVLDRRVGIPITLSVLAIEVGARAGLPVRGVGLPGHFVVCLVDGTDGIFADPFHRGRLLTADDCHDLVQHLFHGRMTFSSDWLRPVGNRQILLRMLSNLRNIHAQAGDDQRCARVLTRQIQLAPDAAEAYRERGLVLARLGRLRAALCDLTTYLERNPGAPDSNLIHQQIDLVLGHISRMN